MLAELGLLIELALLITFPLEVQFKSLELRGRPTYEARSFKAVFVLLLLLP